MSCGLQAKDRSKGFSILEVVVAMVVGLIGLLGVAGMMLMMVSSIDVSKKLSIATALGQEQLERIVAAGYTNAIAANYPDQDYGTITGNPQFRRTVSISTSNPEANMRTITVTVSWIGPDGSARDVLLNTILVREGTG